MPSKKVDRVVINGVEYIPASQASKPTGPEVIVRTYSAGVHIGILDKREGKEVTLSNARRLWKWTGAFTLNAVATNGVNRSDSRISVAVPSIVLTEAIEIIPIVEDVDLSTTEVGNG